MAKNHQFERENQSLAVSSCGATLASVVLAVMAITTVFPQYSVLENALSFLKIVFSLSIGCSLLSTFSFIMRESQGVFSDFLLYSSVIVLIVSMLFLIPVVAIFL